MTLFILKAMASFLCMFVTDLCWAFYVSRVKDGNPLKSGLWAVSLFITGAFAVISYVNNAWLLVPAALGAFCGTYLAVWIEQRNIQDQND